MSQLLKEDTIFEKVMKKYNYFTDNKDLLNEYDKMKKDGADINLISKYIGLSIDEIQKL